MLRYGSESGTIANDSAGFEMEDVGLRLDADPRRVLEWIGLGSTSFR
jgi:hypothetical protein